MNPASILFALCWFVIPWAAHAESSSGQQAYDRWCLPCHADNNRSPGTLALAVKYHGSEPAVLEQRKDLSGDFVAYVVRNGDTVMPFFRKTEVSDAQLADIIAYLKKPGENPK